MKCEKCKAEFAVEEQAKTKGGCPSCGEKLPATAYCDDVKARMWYQFRSSMPLSMILAYVYLLGGGMLALLMVEESVNLGLWTVTDPTGWLFVVMVALVLLLPFFALFFTPSARRWRAICRGDMLAYEAAVESGKPTHLKCKTCHSEFTLWKLVWKKGCCPSCGEKMPVSEYCPGVPDRQRWRLFRDAPLCMKISVISLALFSCFAAYNFLLAETPIMMAGFREMFIRGIAKYVVVLLMLFHTLKAVMRGRIPCVGIMALGALGWWKADSFCESVVVILLPAIFLLSFSMPSSRRWARKIREENLSYWIAARSGAFPFRRMATKCILKKMVIGALLVVCLWLCACAPASIERMCDWVEVPFCVHGMYMGPMTTSAGSLTQM